MGLRTSSSTRLGRSGHKPGTGGLQGNAWIKCLPVTSLGSLPTAELFQGWFEAQVAHRISPRPHTVLGTAPASRPHRTAICHRLFTPNAANTKAATATSCQGMLPPELGAGLPGSHAAGGGREKGETGRRGRQGKGVPVPKHTPGKKANRSVLAMGRHSRETRAVRGAGLHNSLATERETQHRCLVSEGL